MFQSRVNICTRLLVLSSMALAGIKPCGDLYDSTTLHPYAQQIYRFRLTCFITFSFVDVHGNYLSHFLHLLS